MQMQSPAARLTPAEVKAKLWQLEEQMGLLIEHTPAAIAVLDCQMRYLLVSRRWLEDYRLGDRDIIGCSHYDIFPEIPDYWKKIHQRCLAGAVERCDEEAFMRADGTIDWLKWEIRPWRNDAGEVGGLMLFTEVITHRKQAEASLKQLNESLEQQVRERTDELQQVIERLKQEVSDRKRAEAQLSEQEQFLRTVIDATPDWIFAKDTQFRYILVNQSFANDLGRTVEDLLGKDDLELGFSEELVFGNPEKGIRGFRTDDQSALAGETIHNPADPATVADGSLHVFDAHKMPLLDQTGTIFAVLGVSHDLTERYQTEAALRRSQLQLKEKAEQLEQAMQRLQRTQVRLIQNEKMSSLGQLVAGVTHEINNPVSFIYGNLPYADDYIQSLLRLLTLYQQHYPNPATEIQTEANAIDFSFLMEDLPKLLGSMKAGAERIQKIVASLRTFSRMDETTMQTIDLHEVMDSTLMILQNRCNATDNRPEIAVITNYSNLPPVECCTGQLNQVFMNILSNAIDAIEEGIGSSRTCSAIAEQIGSVKTSNPTPHSPLSTPAIRIQTKVVDHHQVQIRIADNGPGIPADVQQRLFDPFFTTKPVGKGTGMGLSICYQIVTEKHRGSIHCVSEPGEGAEFIIQIPVRQS